MLTTIQRRMTVGLLLFLALRPSGLQSMMILLSTVITTVALRYEGNMQGATVSTDSLRQACLPS